MQKFKTPLILSLLVLVTAGCGSRRPKWLGGRAESDIIPPKSTAPLPASAPAPASPPASQALTPAKSSVGTPTEASQTLSQAQPKLLGGTPSAKSDKPLSLTDLESLGGDLPWTGAKPETLSDRLAQAGPKIEYRPRLAPLPEAQALDEAEAQDAAEPIAPKPATVTAQEKAPSGSSDDVRSRLTAAGLSDAPPASTTTDAKPPSPPPGQSDKDEQIAMATPGKAFVEGKEEIVAGTTLQINDQHVTIDEILSGLHEELANIPKHVSRERFRTMAAKIITREMSYESQRVLMYAEADRRLEDGVKDKIKEEMAGIQREMIAEVGGSIEALKEKFRREGTTLEDVLKNHKKQLTSRYYMRMKFGPAIIVNRRMLWNYYQKYQTDFVVEREVQMQIIAAPYRRFLPKGTRNPTEEELEVAKTKAKETIEQAKAELQAGKDFGDVAKRLSKGLRAKQEGLWPMMAAGNFRTTRVENEAFTLPKGKYSDIIEGKDGYYIVKAFNVKPGKITPFVEAQDQIERILRNRQYDKLSAEYMEKLFKNAVVDSPPEFIPLAVERAIERYKAPQ